MSSEDFRDNALNMPKQDVDKSNIPPKRELDPKAWDALQKLQTESTLEGAAGHDYVPLALTRSWENYAEQREPTPEEKKRADELMVKLNKMKKEQAERREAELKAKAKGEVKTGGGAVIKDLAYN